MVVKTLHPAPQDHGTRLDQFLVAALTEVSRSRVQLLIEQGKVTVAGKQQKPSYRIEGGEEVIITGEVQPPPLQAIAEDIPLDIVFEDASLAVINKPAGMMVHAGASIPALGDDDEPDPRSRGTLVNALLYRFNKLSKVGGELRPGIVHRLDKDTSGLMVAAKNDVAHQKLSGQFAARQVKKTYIALVHGWPRQSTGTVRDAIGRDPAKRHRMKIGGVAARDAVSHFKVLRQLRSIYGRFSLLQVTIETGRTHQIRVHLASIGHPVVGDKLYGAQEKIATTAPDLYRAQRADTKATRDRAQSELARELTEAAMGAPSPAAKKAKQKAATPKKSGNAKSKLEKARLEKAMQEEIKQKKATPENIGQESVSPPREISLARNFLHAGRLEFTHPKTGKPVSFEAALPAELKQFLDELERHPA